MYDHMSIDWLTFSLKPDQLSENKRDIDVGFIFDFLNLQILNFENVGGRNGYPLCWDSGHGVSVMCPTPERYEQMGYCVSMTGRGLEWYASQFSQFNIYEFMCDLIALPETGLSLNISRFDIALDDKPEDGKSGCLNLDTIIRKAEAHEYISTSRTKNTIREIIQYKGDNITGRTIYFGSRKSTSYVRIYDKAAEQGVAGHWIRVEFEFKQETAMRIVNAMCQTGSGFPQYFSEIVNHYLRFIELDDINRSRCSVSDFWSKFLGTVKKSKLSIKEYKQQTVSKLLNYILHAMAPSLYTLNHILPDGFLWDIIIRNGMSRLSGKHYSMMDNPDIWNEPYSDSSRLDLTPCRLYDSLSCPTKIYYSNSEKWSKEMPLSLIGQLALA